MISKNYDEVYEIIPGDGWLTKEEGRLLYHTAVKTEGSILEVGCYFGRSTVLLASLGRLVRTVDPFSGFHSEHQDGVFIFDKFCSNVMSRRFNLTIERGGMQERHAFIDPAGEIVLYTVKVEDWTPVPCGFAYLDGDHSYDGTVAQIKKALACGPKWIACHDFCNDGEGKIVARACRELLGEPRERCERMAVWEMV